MTAMRVRLLLRLYRFEAVFFGVLALAAAGGLAVVAWRMPAVLEACQAPMSSACAMVDLEDKLLGGLLGVGRLAVVALPVLAGLLLGIACVGRELERGTTVLAWSLGRSRRRWLLGRVLALGVALLAMSALLAVTATYAEAAMRPGEDPGHSFEAVEAAGLTVVARGLAAFGLGLLAGSLMGRVLPALLLSIVAVFGCAVGVNMTLQAWLEDQAVVLGPTSQGFNVDRVVDVLFRDRTTGALLGQDEVYNRAPPPDDPDWPYSVYDEVFVGVPGARAPEYVALGAALYAAVALVAVGATLVVVDRRRPA